MDKLDFAIAKMLDAKKADFAKLLRKKTHFMTSVQTLEALAAKKEPLNSLKMRHLRKNSSLMQHKRLTMSRLPSGTPISMAKSET